MDNDHDILVELKTLVGTVIRQQADFLSRYETLANRVAILENKDSRDSEKFKTLSDEIRRSLNNAERITSLQNEIKEITDWKKDFIGRTWQMWMLIASLVISQVWQWFVK